MSDQYDAMIAAAEKKYGIPAGLLLAQKSTESGGDPRAVSPKGAIGLMQFMPATAKAYGIDPTDPAQSIDGAARLMRDNLKAANGDPTEALRLYQGGPNRAGWGPQNHAYPATVYGKMGDSGLLTAMGLSAGDDSAAPAQQGATPAAADPGQPVDEHQMLGATGLAPQASGVSPQTAADMGVKVDKDGGLVVDVTGGHLPEIKFPYGTNADHATQQVRALFAKGADPEAISAFIKQHGGTFTDPNDEKQLFSDYETDAGTGVDPRWRKAYAAHPDSTPFQVSVAPEQVSTGDAADTGLRNLGSLGWNDEAVAYLRSKIGLSPDGQGPAALYSPGLTGNQIYDKALGIERAHSDAAWNEHPYAYATGGAVGMAPTMVLAPGSTLPKMMASGAVLGGVSGAGNATDGNRLAGGAEGAALGAALAPVGKAVATVGGKAYNAVAAPVLNRLISGARAPADVAISRIGQRIAQDAGAGGPNLDDMLTAHALTPDKPLTLLDLAGENVRGLGGRVARAPGEGRSIIAEALNNRDQGAGSRISDDIRAAINPDGSAFDAHQGLMASRAQAAAPLYDKAFEGGSVAPLEDQFQQAFQQSSGAVRDAQRELASARNALTQSKAGVSRAGDNVYSASSALRADGAASNATSAAEQRVAAAQAEHEGNLARLRQAQTDGTANAPGAVWSPRIQQFLDDPIMKGGMQRGLDIQRIESVAAGKPFNPSEYAITGTDDSGKPIVGAVPNMRLLDAGKRGLDALIADHTDPVTGKTDEYGRAVTQFKNSFLSHLDGVNPDYASARAAYSGPSTSMDAMARGQQIMNQPPEATRAYFAKLGDGDKEFFRQGAADSLLRSIARTGAGGDESKRLIGNDYVRQQLRPLFSDDAGFNSFMNRIQAESRMFNTRQAILGNSATAARNAEDASPAAQSAVHGVNGLTALATGNTVGAIKHGFNALSLLSSTRDPATNAAIANLLTSHIENGAINGSALPVLFNSALDRSDPTAWQALGGHLLPPAAILGNKLLPGNATSPR
jgi:hypothetical protein